MFKTLPETTFGRLDVNSIEVAVVSPFKLHAMKLRAPYQADILAKVKR
jgi:hypothetical protein